LGSSVGKPTPSVWFGNLADLTFSPQTGPMATSFLPCQNLSLTPSGISGKKEDKPVG
jgi:hypothetical protein